MKILFLDIDGVVNCSKTPMRHDEFIGIDPHMALLVGRIIESSDIKMVLSSAWRFHEKGREEVKKRVYDFIDMTPAGSTRGAEIKQWLDAHPEVTKYAILDDCDDILEEQMPNFFKTSWETGITEEIANRVIEHLR